MNERPPLPSLLDRAPALPGLALADLTDDERQQGEGTAKHPCGEFSAARFAQLYPERYELIARALLEGFSLDCAARVFKVHERTAAAIREREARSLSAEAYRGIQARRARGLVMQASDLLAERMRRDPESVSFGDLSRLIREAHNIERSLEGAPASVVGVIRSDGASAALADLLRQAAEAAGNRFEGGKSPPREVPSTIPAEAVEVVASDTDSHADANEKPLAERVSVARDTGLDTPSASAGVASEVVGDDDGRRSTGAGGVPAQQGGPFREDRSAPENFCPVATVPQVGDESKEGEDSDAR
jgi:hypothetical protein